MCVQIITTPAPLSWLLLLYLSHQVPDDQRIETKMQSDKPNTELFIFSLKVNPFLHWQELKKKNHFESALLQTWGKKFFILTAIILHFVRLRLFI